MKRIYIALAGTTEKSHSSQLSIRSFLTLGLGLALMLFGLGRPGQAQAQIGLAGEGPEVSARALAQYPEAAPGEQVWIAVELAHGEHFHSWPNVPVIPPELGPRFPGHQHRDPRLDH